MPGDYVNVTMQTVMGVLEEKFNAALGRVVKDIADPAKAAEATREIVIRLKLKPDDQRASVIMESDIDAKLARSKPTKSFVLVSLGDEGPVAKVSNARQMTLQEQLEAATQEKEA
jgi:hypothetical protein